MENCVFCKILKNEIPVFKIWEDDRYLGFLDANPVMPGHVLLIPRKHSDYIFDLEDDEYNELFLAAKKLAKTMKMKLKPKRIGVAIEGFGVPHAHIHLIPINHGHELNPANAKKASIEDLKKMADIILN